MNQQNQGYINYHRQPPAGSVLVAAASSCTSCRRRPSPTTRGCWNAARQRGLISACAGDGGMSWHKEDTAHPIDRASRRCMAGGRDGNRGAAGMPNRPRESRGRQCKYLERALLPLDPDANATGMLPAETAELLTVNGLWSTRKQGKLRQVQDQRTRSGGTHGVTAAMHTQKKELQPARKSCLQRRS